MKLSEIGKYSKIENDVKVVKIAEGKIIRVRKYLPSEEKMGFVMDLLSRCVDLGKILPVSVDIVTYVNFVVYYSDLEIDLAELDIFKTYDLLVQTGVLKKILEVIPEEEIDAMFEYIKESIENEVNRANSIAGGLGQMGSMIAEIALPAYVDMVKENPEMLEEPQEPVRKA